MTAKTLIKDILLTTSGVTAFALLALSPVLAYAAEPSLAAKTVAVQSMADKAQLSGHFEGRSDHVTSGEVSIVKTATGYELVLADNFSLDGAPDPVIGFGVDGKYDKSTNFTELEKKTGGQTYALPDGFVPANFNQVFIWCDRFSVPLGVADIS